MKVHIRREVRGVNSDGFRTILFPVASAGATFHENMRTRQASTQDRNGTWGEEHTRKVPWSDLTDNADRFMPSVCQFSFVCFRHLSKMLVRPAGIMLEDVNGTGDVNVFRPTKCLASVHSFNCCQLVCMFFHQLCKPVEQISSVCCTSIESPRGIECIKCGLNCAVDICLCCFGDFGDGFSGGCKGLVWIGARCWTS